MLPVIKLSVANKTKLLSVAMLSVIMQNVIAMLSAVAPFIRPKIVGKLSLTGRNLGRVFNFRIGCINAMHCGCFEAKQT